jgi:hypothetical protein
MLGIQRGRKIQISDTAKMTKVPSTKKSHLEQQGQPNSNFGKKRKSPQASMLERHEYHLGLQKFLMLQGR